MRPGADSDHRDLERPVIGWIEALFIVSLIAVSLSFLAGGAFLFVRGVPATDRFGTIVGSVLLRGQGTSAAISLTTGRARPVVVAIAADGHSAAVAGIDGRGGFRLRLRPGEYTLRAEPRGASFTAMPRRVVVQGGQLLDARLRITTPATSASVR